MAGFLYFTSDTPKAALEHLGYAFESKPIQHEIVGAGPSGKRGIMLAGDSYKGSMHLVGYHASRQTWRRVPGVETDLWCGFYTDDRPGTEDCKRKEQIDGLLCTLGDGNQWLCPIARAWSHNEGRITWSNRLPRAMDIDDDGEWIYGDVVPKYQELWQVVCDLWDSLGGLELSTGGMATIKDEAAWAVTALQANYRLGKLECGMLRLINDQTRQEILEALADLKTFNRELELMAAEDSKKNDRQHAA